MFWIILTILVGCLIPLQPLLNAKLAAGTNLPVFAAMVNFAGGLLILSSVYLVLGAQIPEMKKLVQVPWYGYIGGLLGACFVLTGIFVVPKLGATIYIAALLTGQVIMSLAVDHYSLLGAPTITISWQRLLGVVFIGFGLLLVMRKAQA